MDFGYATEKDLLELVLLMKELGYTVTEEQMAERLIKLRQRNGRVITAIDDNGKAVGCVHAFVDMRLAEGEIGEIVSLVVKKEMRGQGIGTKLLYKAKDWISETGCKKIRIRTKDDREKAHQFYIEEGFEKIKSQTIFQIEINQSRE